jgi:hypothetical protein
MFYEKLWIGEKSDLKKAGFWNYADNNKLFVYVYYSFCFPNAQQANMQLKISHY